MHPATDNSPRALHDLYCHHTGIHVPWSMSRHYLWEVWAHQVALELEGSDWPKSTPAEVLVNVIERRKRITRDKIEIRRAWLNFGRITRSPEECIEQYAEEMAERRPRPQYSPNKASVLRATGRPDAPEPPAAKPAAAAIDAALQALRAAVSDPGTEGAP